MLHFSGHVCWEGVCSPVVLQPFVHPGSCDGWVFSSQKLCALCQPVHRSREGVFGGASQISWSRVGCISHMYCLFVTYAFEGPALCSYREYPHLFWPLSTSLTQGPGLFCTLGQSQKRHAGQHPSGVAKSWRHQVPGCKEMGPSSCHHEMDIRVFSNRPEGTRGAFSNWPAAFTRLL